MPIPSLWLDSMAVFAQFGGYSIIQLLILIIVIAAVIGIVIVVIRQMGVQIPQFIIMIAWIVLAAIVGIFAIKLVIGLM